MANTSSFLKKILRSQIRSILIVRSRQFWIFGYLFTDKENGMRFVYSIQLGNKNTIERMVANAHSLTRRLVEIFYRISLPPEILFLKWHKFFLLIQMVESFVRTRLYLVLSSISENIAFGFV